MQNPDGFFLQVFLPPVKILDFAELFVIQGNGHGIDRKIPPEQVESDRSVFDIGQGTRLKIVLHSRRSDIEFEVIRENKHGGAELAMGADPAVVLGGKSFCKGDAVAFHHNIDIKVFHVEQQVADKTANHENRQVQLVADLAKLLEKCFDFRVQSIADQSFYLRRFQVAPPAGT